MAQISSPAENIIDGRKLASIRQQKLQEKITKLKIKPKVVSFLIGDDPASHLYTKIKQKKAQEVGVDFQPLLYPANTPFKEVADKIIKLNQDPSINGIMVQLALPDEFLRNHSTKELLELIDPKKDIDGLTEKGEFLPAVVEACVDIIKDEDILIKDKIAVVVGASNLVGKPMAKVLQNLGAKVIVCDRETKDLKEETLKAQILVSATGVPSLIKGDMVSVGVVVIDIGAEKVDGKVLGDVEFETVAPKASKITPVPGGVGPMTVIALLENVVESVRK